MIEALMGGIWERDSGDLGQPALKWKGDSGGEELWLGLAWYGGCGFVLK